VVAETRTGSSCAIPRAPSRTTFCATWKLIWSSSKAACTAAGGKVHWARDADEANQIVIDIIRSHGETEVIKVKTMTSDETALNPALEAAGITPIETDLADLIIQLGADKPSHIVVPALHRNKAEIRRLFMEKMQLSDLGERAEDLAAAARRYLRERFLRVRVGLSGANFAIAESGFLCVVESEGNGRMCTTLPEVLISLVGIEKIIPTFGDLEVFLQLLARSATGERMNPYNSIWTGVRPATARRNFTWCCSTTAAPACWRPGIARHAGLHPLRRLPQHLPRLPPDRRPRLRLRLRRADRRHSDAAVAGDEAFAIAALCVDAVRRLLRSLPGQDRYPRDSDSPA
jgi:hypothetical protein